MNDIPEIRVDALVDLDGMFLDDLFANQVEDYAWRRFSEIPVALLDSDQDRWAWVQGGYEIIEVGLSQCLKCGGLFDRDSRFCKHHRMESVSGFCVRERRLSWRARKPWLSEGSDGCVEDSQKGVWLTYAKAREAVLQLVFPQHEGRRHVLLPKSNSTWSYADATPVTMGFVKWRYTTPHLPTPFLMELFTPWAASEWFLFSCLFADMKRAIGSPIEISTGLVTVVTNLRDPLEILANDVEIKEQSDEVAT